MEQNVKEMLANKYPLPDSSNPVLQNLKSQGFHENPKALLIKKLSRLFVRASP